MNQINYRTIEEFEQSARNVYPGKRSIDYIYIKEFFNWVSNKIMSAFVSGGMAKIAWGKFEIQKIPFRIKNNDMGGQDKSNEFQLYISISNITEAGKSIYLPKTFYKESKTKGSVKIEMYIIKFKGTINIKGVFNRLAILDSHSYSRLLIQEKKFLTYDMLFFKQKSIVENMQLKHIVPTLKRINSKTSQKLICILIP